MKHNIFRYIAIAAALLATAVNAGAQYNITGGIGTSKQVTGPDSNGDYTIRLETFATGTTTVTETTKPVDVILVLDLSSSMSVSRGSTSIVTARTSLSYDDVQNSEVNYLYKNASTSKLYQLSGIKVGERYYLYYTRGGSSYRFIRTNGGFVESNNLTPPNNAAYSTTSYGSIVTFDANNHLYTGSSRIKDLQNGVIDFIDKINAYDLNGGTSDDTRLGNRVSIIAFSRTATTHNPLTSLSNSTVQQLKESVNGFTLAGGTYAGSGMDDANDQLESIDAERMEEANRVIVMFTDGAPSDNYAAIGNSTGEGKGAYKAKNTYGASVYTIGLFDSTPATNSTTWRYMNYTSSNYPTATVTSGGTMNAGTDGDPSQGFYKDASSEDVDLTAIFSEIASGIGKSDVTAESSTQVRDVVTNSFVLPGSIEAADVHVYTSAATGDASGADDTDPAGWATPDEITSSVTPTIVNVDANGNPTTNEAEVKNKALFVQGFNYSKDDTSEGAGDGNWVGPRFKNDRWFWAGKKLIITFKVKADSESTGGETLTNTEKSGVYVQDKDGNYSCVNYYEQPHKTLTVNIKIRKTGLRHGDSATFELMRIRPKGYNPDGATLKDKIANLEYNLIGKPIPDTHPYSGPSTQPDMSDYYEGMGWQGFKKVILTNKGEDGAEVVKAILALDPYWVYLVLEDDWGWAYTMTGDTNQVGEDGTYTTSSVEVNPFRFHNEEKPNAVKHAEAVMINHFKGSESNAKVEHYKSSKVESF